MSLDAPDPRPHDGSSDLEEVPMMKRALRIAVVLCLPMVALVAVSQAAGAAHKVGPHQYFIGVIDGTDGNTAIPIPIQMACVGPLRPGETGHPIGGQTLAVHQLFPPTIADTLGETGNDSTIDVFFGAPPPATFHAAAKTIRFVHYDMTKGLPTSLTFPCSGTGTVWFVPIPVVPPSQAAAVPVEFESQP
jgi:hypothetical protein